MNKRGFTLIEIIAAVGIMAMLSTILVVVVSKKINSVKETAYETMIESIKLAAEDYVTNNEGLLTSYAENDWINISLETLIENNYFDNNLENPKTKESLSITDEVYVTRSYKGKIESYYNENQDSDPTINLIGGFNIYLKKDETYVEPGVEAYLSDGTNVSGAIVTSGTVDTSIEGVYVLTYTYGSVSVTRNIVVGDNFEIATTTWHTLTINPNEGSFNGSTSNTTYALKEGRSQDVSNYERANFDFTEWTIDCTGCSITGDVFTMGSSDATITANWENTLPLYNYTGTSTLIDDGDGNWRIKFLTSGTLTPYQDMMLDVFLVGGGGGGGYSTTAGYAIRGGGGGGYTATYKFVSLTANTDYPIVVGAGGAVNTAGGSSSAFGYSVNGGSRGVAIYYTSHGTIGGAGGSGGGAWAAGGTNGTSGGSYSSYSEGGPFYGGAGQLNNTREFGESTGTIYAYGGAGTNDYCNPINPPTFTGDNTGTGGNGTSSTSVTGGSGIVIVRNELEKTDSVGSTTTYAFSYTGTYSFENQETDNWRIKFLTSGTFTPSVNMTIDVFLVGGGGGGGYSTTAGYAIRGGGGSGYTSTHTSVSLTANTEYTIIVGNGGGLNGDGTATTAFGYSANGGNNGVAIYYTNSGTIGGAGGSGGGAWAAGGSNGSNGGSYSSYDSGGPFYGGAGQGTTTYAFGSSSETLYAYGGAGTNDYCTPVNPPSFTGDNTGTGGNGNAYGSTGIAIIRSS